MLFTAGAAKGWAAPAAAVGDVTGCPIPLPALPGPRESNASHPPLRVRIWGVTQKQTSAVGQTLGHTQPLYQRSFLSTKSRFELLMWGFMCLLKKKLNKKDVFPRLFINRKGWQQGQSVVLLQSCQDLRSSDIKLAQSDQLFSTGKRSSCSSQDKTHHPLNSHEPL